MGLLDNLKKTAAALKGQIDNSGALDRVHETPDGDVPPNAAAPSESGGDLSDPRRWITPATVTSITGVHVGDAEDVTTDETFGVRFTGRDERGAWRFELHAVDEDVIRGHGGRPDRWIAEQVERHEHHYALDTFGDYCVLACDGDSDFWCYVWIADSCMAATAETPGVDAAKTCERLLRHVYDWPEA